MVTTIPKFRQIGAGAAEKRGGGGGEEAVAPVTKIMEGSPPKVIYAVIE